MSPASYPADKNHPTNVTTKQHSMSFWLRLTTVSKMLRTWRSSLAQNIPLVNYGMDRGGGIGSNEWSIKVPALNLYPTIAPLLFYFKSSPPQRANLCKGYVFLFSRTRNLQCHGWRKNASSWSSAIHKHDCVFLIGVSGERKGVTGEGAELQLCCSWLRVSVGGR